MQFHNYNTIMIIIRTALSCIERGNAAAPFLPRKLYPIKGKERKVTILISLKLFNSLMNEKINTNN